MALDVGSAYVDIQPRIGAGFFAKVGASMGGLKKIGLAAGAVLGLGMTAGIAGAFAAFKIGENFDQAFDTIRVGTGAQGTALASLEEDFKATFASVPASMDDASVAIADLNTRLGLTGEPLQDLAAQFLEMTRMTGGDLAGNIKSITRLFGDWGVATEDQAGVMDQLWVASQTTGIGIDELAKLATDFGAPLRQLGYGMDESIAIFSKWNKEGVNTEAIMGGLKAGLGRLAKETDDVPGAFRDIQEAILNAGSATEATKIAVEAFGTRAGPDLAAALREGRFEVDDLMASIDGSSETIMGAASDTESFGQKWKKFANKLMVAVEPIATRVFDAVGEAMDRLAPHIPAIIAGFETFFGLVGGWIATGARWWNEYKDEIIAFAQTAWGYLQQFIEVVQTVFETLRGIFSSDGAGVEAFGGKWAEIWDKVVEVFNTAYELVMVIWELLVQGWEKYGDDIVAFATVMWETIQSIISGALDIITGIFDIFIGIFTGDWQRAWDGIVSILDGVKEIMLGLVGYLWEGIKLAFQLGWDAVQLLWDRTWESIKSAASAVWDTIARLLGEWWGDVTGAFTGGVDTITGVWDGFWNALKGTAQDAWLTFLGWVTGAWDTFKGWWDGVWGSMGGSVSSAFSGIVGVVKGVFNGMLRAVGRGINLAVDIINKAIRGLNIINPFQDVSYVPKVSIPQLAEGGTAVTGGTAWVGEDGPELVDLPTGASVIPLDKMSGGRPFNVTMMLDGRVLARATGPHLVDDLVLHSGQRR